MTNSFLIVDANSLETRLKGPALGDLRIVINGCDFPSARWNDFVVVVLGWWIDAILRLLNKINAQETVNFMDGPYAVEITAVSSSILQFRTIGGTVKTDVAVGEALIVPFSQELIAQSRQVLNECIRQNWWSNDAQRLQSLLKSLECALATNAP
jgi:hypothetical protein